MQWEVGFVRRGFFSPLPQYLLPPSPARRSGGRPLPLFHSSPLTIATSHRPRCLLSSSSSSLPRLTLPPVICPPRDAATEPTRRHRSSPSPLHATIIRGNTPPPLYRPRRLQAPLAGATSTPPSLSLLLSPELLSAIIPSLSLLSSRRSRPRPVPLPPSRRTSNLLSSPRPTPLDSCRYWR
ncbi:WAS/WASL-interacting protein family member 1-like [Zingiber officinale]|uniref:WAS/WASL-interacting protein family member 1-like n=1 Tax=Zingiber officinale TaxID=94328 RepID=UPI001C4CB57C|nr:WAS/WASL-interacting protein family member 1-like [Zingiber officinale]